MTEPDPRFTVTYFRRTNGAVDPDKDPDYSAYADSIGHAAPKSEPPLVPLDVICAADLGKRDICERPWVVRDLIPDRQVSLFTGDGGTGKSLLALQLAVAMAAGRGWIGQLPEAGGGVYLSAEDDLDEVHRRLRDITSAAAISFDDLSGFHILPMAGKDAVLALPERKSDLIIDTPLWRSIVDKVTALRPRLLIIDNLADVFAGNENSRPQTRQFVSILRGLAIEHGLAVLILGHPSLTGLSSGTGTSGSTAWSNSVRSRLYLDRAKADDGEEPDPDLRILRVMKANYSPIGAEIRMRWEKGRFKLEGGGAGAFDRMANDSRAETTFLDLLRAFREQDRDVSSKVSNSYAPAVFAAHPNARGNSKKAFANAMNRLFERRVIRNETFGPRSKERTRIVLSEDASNGLPT